MTSGLAEKKPMRRGDFRFKNVSGRKIRWNSPVRSGVLVASPEVMYRSRSDFPLNFDIKNI